jgi:hypothetical protein
MFKYRVVLRNGNPNQKRPSQAHFNAYDMVADWAEKMLAQEKEDAYVEIYTTMETRSGTIKKTDLPLKPNDQSAGAYIQPATKKAG